jgi:hypothetical protein
MVSVFDVSRENRVADVEWLAVWSEAGTIAASVAIRSSRAASIDYLLIAEPVADHLDAPDTTSRVVCRIGEIETDARMLFYRSTPDRAVSRLALVDGSMVRAGGRGFQLDLHEVVPDYFANFDAREERTEDQGRTKDPGRTKNQDPRTKDLPTCAV